MIVNLPGWHAGIFQSRYQSVFLNSRNRNTARMNTVLCHWIKFSLWIITHDGLQLFFFVPSFILTHFSLGNDIIFIFFSWIICRESEQKMMRVIWAKRQKLRHGRPQYTNSCVGHSLAVKHPAKHWILVLPHTSLHTTWHVVTLMAKILIILIGCEGIEVMRVFDVRCYNSAASTEVSNWWHFEESHGIVQERT